jgi:hypothetical protein
MRGPELPQALLIQVLFRVKILHGDHCGDQQQKEERADYGGFFAGRRRP